MSRPAANSRRNNLSANNPVAADHFPRFSGSAATGTRWQFIIMSFKEFIFSEAERLGVSIDAIKYRYYHGHYLNAVTVQAKNKRVVEITVTGLPAKFPKPRRWGLSFKALGSAKYKSEWRKLRRLKNLCQTPTC